MCKSLGLIVGRSERDESARLRLFFAIYANFVHLCSRRRAALDCRGDQIHDTLCSSAPAFLVQHILTTFLVVVEGTYHTSQFRR